MTHDTTHRISGYRNKRRKYHEKMEEIIFKCFTSNAFLGSTLNLDFKQNFTGPNRYRYPLGLIFVVAVVFVVITVVVVVVVPAATTTTTTTTTTAAADMLLQLLLDVKKSHAGKFPPSASWILSYLSSFSLSSLILRC
jgi:hypothetical protein